MRRSARREEAYVPTSQLRRFTLPDSAPIMRRVMGFLSDQARTLIHAGVSRDRICIDPGPGFGKSANEDIVIQRETARWRHWAIRSCAPYRASALWAPSRA